MEATAVSSSSVGHLGKRKLVPPTPQESLLYSYTAVCGDCGTSIENAIYACKVCASGLEWCESCALKTNHNIEHPFIRLPLTVESPAAVEVPGDQAQQLWKQCTDASPLQDNVVPFLTFVDQLSKFLKTDLTQGDVTALEAILGDISIQDEISVNSLELTQLDYALFIRRFGPLQLCLKKINQVLTDGRQWFHGNMALQKATDIFKGKQDKAFLIRYSSRTPGAFSINYIKDGTMKIFNRITNNIDGEGLFVHNSAQQKLQYSSFASFIRSNNHIFSFPLEDPLMDFLRIKKQQLLDMGTKSSAPFTFNFVVTQQQAPTIRFVQHPPPDDFYDALARKADGFTSQMMATSSPTSSPASSRQKVSRKPLRSSSPTPKTRSGGGREKEKGGRASRDDDSSGQDVMRSLKVLSAKPERRHASSSTSPSKSPIRKRREYVPGGHYSNFFSDDEDEELPNMVADS